MTDLARALGARHTSRVPDAPRPALSTEALVLQSKLAGGALPLTSLTPADRTGLDNLSRRGVVRLLLGLGGEVVVARSGR